MTNKQKSSINAYVIAALAVMFVVVIILSTNIGSSRKASRDSDVFYVGDAGFGDKVGMVELEGIIYRSEPIIKQFKKLKKDKHTKAIVFRINSPGGGIAASQEIFEYVKAVRDSGMPVIVSMGSVAASGGYYVALGADSIMANPGTTTGSIGVIAEFPDISELLGKLGIKIRVLKSGALKDAGSPYRKMTENEKAYLQAWIDDGYEQFIGAVSQERDLELNNVRKLADGRIYSGEQAFQHGLIDTLGTLQDAIYLAAACGGIDGEPKVVKAIRPRSGLFDLVVTDLEESIKAMTRRWPQIKYQLSY